MASHGLIAVIGIKRANVNGGQVINDAVLQTREQKAKGTTVKRPSHRKKVARVQLKGERHDAKANRHN